MTKDLNLASQHGLSHPSTWPRIFSSTSLEPLFPILQVGASKAMKIPTEHFGRRADRIDDLFKAVVTSVEYGFRKPHSGIFKHGMDLVGALAEHSFYVGDTFEADYVGSASVGMRGFLIDPDRRHDVKPSARLESLFDLEGRLRALEI